MIEARYRALDGLRGVAAMLVVLYHIELCGAAWPNHITSNNFVRHGYLAVDLFFILSGLVISSSYLGRIRDVRDAKSFLILRFFRLYPVHVAVLGILVLLELAKLGAQDSLTTASPQLPFTGDRSLGNLVASLFLANGLPFFDVRAWNGPSWSISCEYAAYMAFCVVVLSGVSRSGPLCLIGGLVACFSYVALAFGHFNWVLTGGIVRCFAGFTLGFLLFRFVTIACFRNSRRLACGIEVSAAISLLLVLGLATGPYVVTAIPLFVVLVASLRSDAGPIACLLNLRPLRYLGRFSYSIYMVHSSILLVVVLPLLGLSGMANPWIGDAIVVAALVSVLAAAHGTSIYIEEPGRLFGRRHFSIRRNAPQTA
jgi:peptidoglycan/LPS O-acetylase OafA/YrhL